MASILERTMKRNAPRTSLQILEDLEDHSDHSFAIDCGTRKVKFLSHDQAKHKEHLNHPRKQHAHFDKDDLRAYEKWPIFTSFGNHHVDTRACPNGIVWIFLSVIFVLGGLSLIASFGDPDDGVAPDHELAGRYIAGAAAMTAVLAVWVLLMGLADMGRKEQAQRDKGMQPTPLYEYGVGNVLYFKMLKFLVSVLLCVSIIALPSVMTFYQNSLEQSSSRRNTDLTGSEAPVHSRASSESMAGRTLGATFLARSTLASLGAATPLCYRREGIVVPGTQRLDFSCPNGRMLLQDVWLGHPPGSCGCPSAATPSHGYADGSCTDGPVLTEPTLGQPCCSNQHALKPRTQLPNTSVAAWKHVPFNLCYKVRKCTLWLDKTYFVGGAKRCQQLLNGTNTSVCQNFTLLDGLDTSGSPVTLHVQGKCFQRKAKLMHGGDSTKQDVVNLTIGLDLVGTWFFLMLVLWLQSEQRREERHFDQVSIDVSDYSVAMPVLPSHKSSNDLQTELKLHLLQTLNSKSAKRHARRMRGKKAAAIDIQIAEMHFGYDDLQLLEMQKKHSTLKQHLELCFHRLQCAKAIHNMHSAPKTNQEGKGAKPKGGSLSHGGHLPKEMRKIRRKIEKAAAELKKQDDNLLKLAESMDKDKSDSDIDRVAHCAFITFAEEEGKLRCLKEFPDTWWGEYKQHCGHVICPCCHKDKRLRGAALHFYDPPMPSDINWENLVLNPVKRVFKIVLVSLMLIVLLGISFSVLVAIRYQKQKWNSKYPAVTCQPSDVTKEKVESSYREAGFKPTPILSCYCKKHIVSNAGEIVSSVQEGDLSSLSSSLSTEFVTGNDTLGQPRKERLCQEWFMAESFRYLAMHFMAWTILIINYIITHRARHMVKFIRFKHVSEELVHTALFSIICMGVNTILVPLAVHSNIPGLEKFGLDGDYSDFTVSWYNDVGTLMFVIMIYNLFVPHMHLVYEKPYMQARLWLDRSCSHDVSLTHKLTQHDLDNLYLGPRHNIAARSAQALNMVFVGVVYSAAMPLMPLLATLNVIVLYVTDKWAFLRVYRRPPAYDASLALFVSQQLQYAGWVHCICAIVMFTAPDIVQGEPANSMRRAFVESVATHTNIDVLQYGVFRRIFNAPWTVVLFAVFLIMFSIYLVLKEFIEDWILLCLRLVLCRKKPDYEHNPSLLKVLPAETLAEILEDPQAYLDNDHVLYDMTADELRQTVDKQISRRRKQSDAAFAAGHDDYNPLDARELIGLPSYDLMINPRYAFAMGEDANEVRKKLEEERNSLSGLDLSDLSGPESRRMRDEEKGQASNRKSSRHSSRKASTRASGESDVPAPWEAHLDKESGHTYYYNTKSGETRWELPDKSERKKRRALKRKSRRQKINDADARRTAVATRAGLDSNAITMSSNQVRESKKKLVL